MIRLLIGLFVFQAMPALASTPLTLSEVLSSVKATYPPLFEAEQERAIAEANRLGAEGGFDASWKTRAANQASANPAQPRLESVIEQPTSLWGMTVFGGYRAAGGTMDSRIGSPGQVQAGVSLPLLRDGPIDRRRANLSQAEARVTVAEATVEFRRLDSMRQAAIRYWEWVAAGRRRAIMQELLAIAKKRDKDIAETIRLGVVAPIEQQENERTVLQRQSQLVSAERALEQAAIELSLFLRDRNGVPLLPSDARLLGSLPEPQALDPENVAKDHGAALQRRPELRLVSAQLEQAMVELAWAKNQLSPALTLGVTGSRDVAGAGEMPPGLEASVQLDIPLQTRLPRGRIAGSEATVAQIEQQRRLARDRVQTEIQDALSALEAARKRVQLSRREVAVALKLEAAERERFKLGESTLLIVNLREQATAEAAVREVDALADFQRAWVVYQVAIADFG